MLSRLRTRRGTDTAAGTAVMAAQRDLVEVVATLKALVCVKG